MRKIIDKYSPISDRCSRYRKRHPEVKAKYGRWYGYKMSQKHSFQYYRMIRDILNGNEEGLQLLCANHNWEKKYEVNGYD